MGPQGLLVVFQIMQNIRYAQISIIMNTIQHLNDSIINVICTDKYFPLIIVVINENLKSVDIDSIIDSFNSILYVYNSITETRNWDD